MRANPRIPGPLSRPIVAIVLATVGFAGGVAACDESTSETDSSRSKKTAPAPASSAPRSAEPAPANVGGGGDFDAGDGAQPTAADEPAPYDGPFIGALFGQTPIMSDMAWPKKDEERNKDTADKGAERIGYIRQGQKVPVLPQPHPKSNCKDGWYELVQGGFVCGRYASLDLNHPKIKFAPHPPDLDSPLPYQYGYNVANGTPLYRTIPSREERLKLEPWLAPKPKKPKPVEPSSDDAVAAYGDDLDAGAPLTLTRTTTTITATTTDPFGLATEEVEDTTPWYLRQYDGGKPTVTLDELKGEGPMARRMVKGFFVGLDKQMSEKGSKWWRTTNSLLAPFERIYVHNSASKFQGIWLDAASDPARKPTPDLCKPGSKSQVGIVTYYKAKKYDVSASRKAVGPLDSLARHAVVKLTGETVLIDRARYNETDEGWWVKASEITKTNPGDPPKDLAPGEKWIDISLSTQTLVAFEGDKPVFATAVSTGREDKTDKEKNHKTPTGTWRIREKHIAATMDGDVASDGPYSIEDVPWIMYYSGSYAIHGAFWHNNFGRTRSHGCTNLAPADAKALFGWTEPRMPESWHGVWSTPEKPGTLVVVHE